MLNFRDAGIKKARTPLAAWLLLTVMKKKYIIYNFGDDFCFQNEELKLSL